MKACSARVHGQEPALRIISIQLKYGPWRDALVVVWKRHRKEGEGVIGRAGRAAFIVKLLKCLCQAMHMVSMDAWVDNLGLNIGYVCGPVPTLQRLGILKKAVTGKRGRGVLCFSTKENKRGQRAKRLCVGIDEHTRARALVGKLIDLSDAVGDVKAPRTCREWVEVQQQIVDKMVEIKPPGMAKRIAQ